MTFILLSFGIYIGIGIILTIIFGGMCILGNDMEKFMLCLFTCPLGWPAWTYLVITKKL